MNSPATFQMTMNGIFIELIDKGVVTIYIIFIFGSQTKEQHYKIIVQVLDIHHKHHLYLKVEKCTFEQPTVEYLLEGHVEMDPVKVAGVRDWLTPWNVTKVQSFIGFINFY